MKHRNEGKALFCESDLATSRYVIYTPSQFAKSSLIYLQETGTLTAVKPYRTGRSGLGSFLFFIVLRGSGSFIYDGVPYAIHTGDCVFIDCRSPYSQISSQDLWTLQWAHFSGSSMEQIYEKYREHGGKPVFSTRHSSNYRELLDQIYHCSEGNSYVHSMLLAEKLTSLLALLMQETRDFGDRQQKPAGKVDLAAVKRYLEEHYRENFTLDQLAEHFYIDKYYLTKIFRAEYDTTINTCLSQLRITRAKELLRFTDLSVEEIGREVGIPDQNYFARVFKKIEGLSPSQYRMQW